MNTTKLMLGQWCSPEIFLHLLLLCPFFAPSSYARNSCIVLCLFRVTQDDIPAVQYDRTTHKLALRHAIYIPGSSAPAGHTPPYLQVRQGLRSRRRNIFIVTPLHHVKEPAGFDEMSDCSLTLAGIKHHPVSGRSWLSQTTVHPRRHPT
ncbi:hypothetical protein F5X96DRAFT_550658 [Biscogniauxia mediterranea]|nr:hypothetical protein F5X96DRAFT_550658 [Biscogniauxia mediterranea]